MMELILKLGTALRGGVRENLETLVDANALRIFEQEIYQGECQLKQTRQQLAQVMAEKVRMARELKALQNQIQALEQQAGAQLAGGEEAAALESATTLVRHEARLEQLQEAVQQLQQHEEALMQGLKRSQGQLEHYRAELRLARATQRSQQVLGTARPLADDDHFSAMQDSLRRIRTRQQAFQDQLQAMQEIDSQLQGNSPQAPQQEAAAILERLRTGMHRTA
ncbi:MAG: PspA/IM30 family protein [Thiothrix sp.]|nr:PspA/IM30 family protein [Thiothrix sp.]HPQ95351.1 PspA/IM30 family protein [Thiolinea sp.]